MTHLLFTHVSLAHWLNFVEKFNLITITPIKNKHILCSVLFGTLFVDAHNNIQSKQMYMFLPELCMMYVSC